METTNGSADPTRPVAVWQVTRIWLYAEILVVLGLSLGRSAVYSLIDLVQALLAGPLSEQSAALNQSLSDTPWTDLLYQLLSIGFSLVPVALVVLLLAATAGGMRPALADLGLDLARPGRDLLQGLAITAAIGIPGVAFYLVGRQIGITVDVIAAALDAHWWTVPVLILAALRNGLLEEVIVVGYLTQRLERLGWSGRRIVLASALLRGAYHTYQGIGPGLANLVMGLVFAEWYRRTRRTMPLVIAHTIIDVFAFVGYALLKDALGL